MFRFSADRFYGWTVVAAAFVVAIFGWGVGFWSGVRRIGLDRLRGR